MKKTVVFRRVGLEFNKQPQVFVISPISRGDQTRGPLVQKDILVKASTTDCIPAFHYVRINYRKSEAASRGWQWPLLLMLELDRSSSS